MMSLDTDVLAIYFIYQWDPRFNIAKKIIESRIAKCTTIYNVLELCGLMAIAQGHLKSLELFKLLHKRRDFKVLYWKRFPKSQEEFVSIVMKYISRDLSVGDAMVSWLIEENNVKTFITYNVKHFKGKILAEVLTPEEYVEKYFKH